MILRVVISTKPLQLPNDAIVLNVVDKTISRGSRIITFRGKKLRHVSFAIYAIILMRAAIKQHLTRPDFYDLVYADDPDGGPIHVHRSIWQIMKNFKPAMARLGLEFISLRLRGFEIIDLWQRPTKAMAA